MHFLKNVVNWTKSLAQRKSARYWLCFISFIESSFFPLPADILFIPLVAAKKTSAYFYAFLATFFSVIGTLLGWAIGRFFYQSIALPLLNFYGKADYLNHLHTSQSSTIILIFLLTSGFSHIPPIKVVTILAGALNMPIGLFVIASFITRFLRFYLLAWLIKNHSDKIIKFFLEKMKWIVSITIIALIIGYLLWFFI